MRWHLVVVLVAVACRRSGPERVEPHRTWSGSETIDSAGESLDVGDAGSEALMEILIGSPDGSGDPAVGGEGGAWVVDASTPSGVLDGVAEGRVTSVAGDRVNDNLGFEVGLVGDLSGDGVGDLVIAGVNESLADDVGYLHVFRGPLDSAVPVLDAWAVVHAGGAVPTPNGVSACGDLNGDGATDLCVETSPTSSDVSQAAILFGPLTPGLIDFATSRSVVLNADPAEQAGERLAGGVDLTGDGVSDLLVGGHRGVYLVSDPPPGSQLLSAFPLFSVEDVRSGGVSLSVGGDLDGDGQEDFFVGDYGFRESRGRGYLVTSSTGGPLGEAFARFDGARKGDLAAFDAAVGDFDGDGASDLAMGIPGMGSGSPRAGRVAVWRGPIRAGPHDEQDADLVLQVSEQEDGFGYALDAGDVDGDGIDDLVVGAPLDSARSPQAGAVHLFLGGTLPF